MALSFDPLWKTLIDKKLKRYELAKQAGISPNVMAKMGRDEYVSLQSIERICLALDCDVNAVVAIKKTSGESCVTEK